MADNFISGNNSYVKLATVAYRFGKWRIPIEGGTKKFFAMGSNYQLTTAGGIAATPVVEGAYDVGNMPLTIGTVYELHLGLDSVLNLELVVSARLSGVEPSVEVGGSDPAGISCTFDSHGPFSVALT